jgi:hypothetical protein
VAERDAPLHGATLFGARYGCGRSPAIRQFKYMMVNDRVVLVDPVTSRIVAELAD